MYSSLAEQLIADTGIDPEWYPCGLLINHNPDIKTAIDWCHQHQVSYTQTTPTSANSTQDQQLKPLWLPDIAQIRNPRLLKSLQSFLLNIGVKFIENCELLSLDIEQQQVRSITTSSGNFVIDHLLLTTGAWTGKVWSKLLPHQDIPVQVEPIKGQMLLIDAKPGLLQHIILDHDRYLIPRRDGRIVVGSTVEHCGFDKQVSAEVRAELLAFALRLLPALKDFPVSHHWSGLRPGTAHGIPYIDQHPEIANLSVCAGHYRNGLTMGPASARLVFDLICALPTQVNPEPYRLTAQH